jgi:hypothetical protein
MGLGLGGLQSGGSSIASILASLVGQDVVAKSYTATQAANLDAFKATVNGARWHIGAGAADYLFSDGTAVNFAGPAKFLSTVNFPTNTLVSFGVGFVTLHESPSTLLNVTAPGGVVILGDTTSPVSAGLTLIAQDAEPTGVGTTNKVGALYVTTAGVLKICTVAGTPGTWVSVGAQV